MSCRFSWKVLTISKQPYRHYLRVIMVIYTLELSYKIYMSQWQVIELCHSDKAYENISVSHKMVPNTAFRSCTVPLGTDFLKAAFVPLGADFLKTVFGTSFSKKKLYSFLPPLLPDALVS